MIRRLALIAAAVVALPLACAFLIVAGVVLADLTGLLVP